MSASVRQTDRGMARLYAVLSKLERGAKVTVGVHADTGAAPHRGHSTATVAEVAAFAELGTPTEAPRAPLRGVMDAERGRLEQGLARAGALAIRGALQGTGSADELVRGAVQRVGDQAAQSVRRRIRALRLRDTGHLEESIEARFVESEAAS